MGGTMNQMKVHFDHKASDMAKTFRMTEADWDIAFNFVFDRIPKKQPTEIIEAVLNRADFSLSQKTCGVYLVGCFVGEEILDRYQKHQREKEEKKWHDSVQLYKGTTNCIDGMLRIIEATPIEYNESSTQYFDLEATIASQYKIFNSCF